MKRCILVSCLIALATTALPVFAAFNVYTGNLRVVEQDTFIHYGSKPVSNKQCLRSRYGRVDSEWPCVVDHPYIPGDVQNPRLFIYTMPYGKKLYSPGFRELIDSRP